MNNLKRVFFRTDSNSDIGMGHLIRCLALAEIIKSGFEISFIFRNTSDKLIEKFLPESYSKYSLPGISHSNVTEAGLIKQIIHFEKNDIIVLDGYQFNSNYQDDMNLLGCKIVFIDDLVSFTYNCDVIINQADFISKNNYQIKRPVHFCLGPGYALLRPAFLKAASNGIRKIRSIEQVFISFGGADSDNITYKVLKILVDIKEIKQIHILSGSVNVNLDTWKKEFQPTGGIIFYSNLNDNEVCDVMKKCELAICPASSLSLELCAVGVPMLTGMTANNQEGYYKGLTSQQAAFGIGEWKLAKKETIENAVNLILQMDEQAINNMLSAQRNYIDGNSGERLKTIFLGL